MAGNNRVGKENPPRGIRTEIVQKGYEYWQEKADGGTRLPSRSDINPAEIPRLTPNVAIMDVRQEPELDFYYRLQGTAIVEHQYGDHTGKWFSEIDHQKAPSQIWANCKRVVDTAEPYLANTPYVGPHSSFREAEDIILPLSDDGRSVDHLLVFVAFIPRTDC